MPSKYTRKGQRTAKAAEEKALAVLQSVCDSDAPQSEKQAAAMAVLEHNRVKEKAGPLRASLAEKIKQLRTVKRQHETAITELEKAKQRIASLEVVEQQLIAAQAEIAQLTAQRDRANDTAHNAALRATTATATAELFKRTANEIVETLFPKEPEKRLYIAAKLFFKHRDSIAPELYTSLGLNLIEWRRLNTQYQYADDAEKVLSRLEAESEPSEMEKQFLSAKLAVCFGVRAKDELKRREQERKQEFARQQDEFCHRKELERAAEIADKQSLARDLQIREHEQPPLPSNVIETIWWSR